MTQGNNLLQTIDRAALAKRMIIGGLFALILMIIFLWGVDHPRPEWGKFWKVRPFLVITFAGATGGACNYFISRLLNKSVAQKIIAAILSFIVFVFGMWMGTVLGLAGTLWD